MLGTVQGLTEFLPVSSAAHLMLIPHLTGWTYLGKDFDVVLHFGSLLALLAYFKQNHNDLLHLSECARLPLGPPHSEDLGGAVRLPLGPPHSPVWNRPLLLKLALATAPAAVVGFGARKWLESLGQLPSLVAWLLLIFGLLLAICDRRAQSHRETLELSYRQALGLGLAQALALLPGVSRSGITLSLALLWGFNRPQAARLSFLMAVPIILGASLFKASQLPGTLPLLPCFLGLLASAGSGWWALDRFLGYLQRGNLQPFALYRVLLALIILYQADALTGPIDLAWCALTRGCTRPGPNW